MSTPAYEDNPVSIKYYVKRYLLRNKVRFKGKRIVDFPAGNGVTSGILKEIGATPVPFDLFPEYFRVDGLACQRANIVKGIPLRAGSADGLICQEGIEHFANQLGAFKEFNRILKRGGTLLVTTPNYSNIRSRLSYFFSESERFFSMMPPNEFDSIWMSKQDLTNEVYLGHIFLIGIQRLRVLAKLSGFRIRHIEFTRARPTSVILFPFLYPFFVLMNVVAYWKSLLRLKGAERKIGGTIYREQLGLSVNPKILVDGHLFVEFEKEVDHQEVGKTLRSRDAEFGVT